MSTGYHKSKEQLETDACKKYQNLSEEKKSKKCQQAREQYQNLCEKKKSENIVVDAINIVLKISKNQLSIEFVIFVKKKNKKQEYCCGGYKYRFEDKKQKLAEYRICFVTFKK